MGYSSRYHAASLAAVFLALAVGILIGVGFGSDVVSGTADDLEQSLASDLDEARAEVDDLQDQLESRRTFEDAVYPAVVSRRLRGDRIGLVALGGLDPETPDHVSAAVGPAGADLASVAVVREPADLEALAQTADGRVARAIERGDERALRRLGQRAGRALVLGGPAFGPLRGTLLSRYSGRPAGIDGVVVVRQRPEGLSAEEEERASAIEEGLIAGLEGPVSAVGGESSDFEPSSIPYFDAQGIPTVDSVDLISGRVALVFTLAGGAGGNFGVKETADSLLPDLLAPRGGRGRGDGGDGAAGGQG